MDYITGRTAKSCPTLAVGVIPSEEWVILRCWPLELIIVRDEINIEEWVTQPRKRVLFISYIFPPMPAGGAIRSGQFAKYLPKFGWQPVVLTVWLPRSARVDEAAVKELHPDTQVLRPISFDPFVGVRGLKYDTPKTGRSKAELLRSLISWMFVPDRQVLWLPSALIAALLAIRRARCDVIFATFGPASNLVLGYCLKKFLKKPLVIDFRDLWSDHPLVTYPTSAHRRAHEVLERLMYKASDRIVVISEAMVDHFSKKYPTESHKLIVIPNGYDPDRLAKVGCAELNPSQFVISYVGSLYRHQTLKPFADALVELVRDGEIIASNFALNVIANLSSDFVREYGLNGLCTLQPFVPHAQAISAMATSHVLLLVENEDYVARYGYAVKLFDYLLVGRPILALTPSWSNSAQLIQRARAGVVVDPGDVKGIKEALRQLLNAWKSSTLAVQPDRSVIAQFDRRLLTKKLAETFDEVAGYHVGI